MSRESNLECPCCGSADVTTSLGDETYVVTKWVLNECRKCGERGDFLAANDEAIEEATRATCDEPMMFELVNEAIGLVIDEMHGKRMCVCRSCSPGLSSSLKKAMLNAVSRASATSYVRGLRNGMKVMQGRKGGL